MIFSRCKHLWIEKESHLVDVGRNKIWLFKCSKCGKEKVVVLDKLHKCTLEKGYVRK
jgi:hypothetical protein